MKNLLRSGENSRLNCNDVVIFLNTMTYNLHEFTNTNTEVLIYIYR